MVKLLTLIVARRVSLLELGGAVAIVGGVAEVWGAGAGWIAGGAFALAKAVEMDLDGGG